MMESTDLSLLTRDGAVAVSFTPPLEQDHYAELYAISCDCETADELRKSVSEAAKRWQRKIVFD